MTRNSVDQDTRPLLGIYTPELSGFYFGELVGQLLTLCRLKNYRVTVIKTGGGGQFKSKIHSEAMDMVIILRNAIHFELAESLVREGKQIASISFDYFPLKIPLISSDNKAGIELAITHLMGQGHKKFLFVGNLTNFDIRKRYEAFCDAIEAHGLETDEEEVYQLDDDLISGGYEAADRYFRDKCGATAIICGTSMNGMGFSKRLEKHDSDLNDLISIVAFDAVSLIPVLNPEITTVDQNFNLIAYKALSIIDKTANANVNLNHHTVEPKLISRDSDFMRSEDAYLATSFEVAELYNANYMKSVIYNITEWSHSIASRKLDNIMLLSTLFGNFIEKASVGRVVMGKSGAPYFVFTKLIDFSEIKNVDVKDAASVCKEALFPSNYLNFKPNTYDTCVHVPRYVNGKLWGFISTYGKSKYSDRPCSYSAFAAYLDHIVEWMNHELRAKKLSTTENEISLNAKVVEGDIIWNKETNELVWEDPALELLGFSMDLEKKIYRNMELYDRLEGRFVAELREYLVDGNNNNLPIEVRYKNKNREFIACDLRIVGEDGDRNTIIKISSFEGG